MASFSLEGKNAIVTGGGSGIGKAICKLFAEHGAKVYIVDFNYTAAMQVADEINRSRPGEGEACYCDMTQQKEVHVVFTTLARRHPIHILVNNAGVSHIGTAESTSEADFDRIFSVNVKGFYNGMHAIIPHMREAGGGVILNMASVAGTTGISDRFAYSMSKGAVISMTYSVAKDYVKHHIRCNCISPARVHTPFVDDYLSKNYPGKEKEVYDQLAATQPIGRMGKPEEVATMALYLCSDEGSFLTGVDYVIDGGFTRLNT